MTDQTEQLDDTTEAAVIEAPEPEETEEGETPEVDTEASGETVVTFGDDEAPEVKETPGWVKDLRKRNRSQSKEISDLKKKLDAGKADDVIALGAEPALEDFDFDSAKHIAAIRELDKAKAKIDAKANEAQTERDGQEQAYNVRLTEYQEGRADFEADSFDEAEGAVKDALTETQQSILIRAFGSKAAPLIRGLGQDEKRLKEIAGISDPIEFTVAVTRLESAMKVSSRKPKTVPETAVKGNGTSTVSGDKILEKLREKAAQTGDMTEVIKHKRMLKAS